MEAYMGKSWVGRYLDTSCAELRTALLLLDSDADGKVWESDVTQLLELAFGPLRRDVDGRDFTSVTCRSSGCGLVAVPDVIAAVSRGEHLRFLDLEKLQREPQANKARRGKAFKSLPELVETFNYFDCDRNGVISAGDLREALGRLQGQAPSREECKRMIRRVDANDDGVVDLSEFRDMFLSMQAK